MARIIAKKRLGPSIATVAMTTEYGVLRSDRASKVRGAFVMRSFDWFLGDPKSILTPTAPHLPLSYW